MKASPEMRGLAMKLPRLLLTLFAFATPSFARDATDSTTTLPEPFTTTLPEPFTTSPPTPSQTSNSLTPSSYPKPPPLPVYPTTTPSPIPATSPHNTNVFNYYFLFLAALALLAIGLVWYFHVRRARRNHAQRVIGQHALARDIEGSAGARRVGHGRRREEGLDEDGEAPPPYQAKSGVGVGVNGDGGMRDGLAVPLGAVVRDEDRPPRYGVETRT